MLSCIDGCDTVAIGWMKKHKVVLGYIWWPGPGGQMMAIADNGGGEGGKGGLKEYG